MGCTDDVSQKIPFELICNVSTSQGRELTEGHLGATGKSGGSVNIYASPTGNSPGKGGNNSHGCYCVLRTVLSALCGLLFNQVLY